MTVFRPILCSRLLDSPICQAGFTLQKIMTIQLKDNSNSDDFPRELYRKQWYKLRSRQASVSFNVAIALAVATAALGFALARSICVGDVSAVTATTAMGLVSGMTSKRLFKLSDDANKRLDEAARELLDD